MRNGNIEKVDESNLPDWSSYPTYEEWKPSRIDNGCFLFLSSYPTYEEWKPKEAPEPIRVTVNAGSYPTYEEWKHFLISSSLISSFSFLSYL